MKLLPLDVLAARMAAMATTPALREVAQHLQGHVNTLPPLGELADFISEHAIGLSEETEQLKGSDHITLIRHFEGIRGAFDKIAEAKKLLDTVHDRLSKDYIPDAVRRHVEKTGVKPPYNIEGVGKVSIAHRFSCSMTDKAEALKWLKDKGYGDMVQETVPSPTLSAFAKNLIETEGKELPEALFKTGTSPYTSIRK